MNYIFLDCDGVVTSTLETPGSYVNHAPEDYGPSPRCVERLLKLCKDTNSKIIISSNWRKFDIDGQWTFDGNKVTNPLSKLMQMLGDNCIGSLPPIRHKVKSVVLTLWLDEHCEDVDNFVVFDDDLNEYFQNVEKYNVKHNFIHTDYITGLTDEDCEEAYRILKGKLKND